MKKIIASFFIACFTFLIGMQNTEYFLASEADVGAYSSYNNQKKESEHPATSQRRRTRRYYTSLETSIESLYANLDIQNSAEEKYLKFFYYATRKFPKAKIEHMKNVIIKDDKNESHRGLAGSTSIMLNAYNTSDKEFSAVAVHELCHIADLGGITEEKKTHKSKFTDGNKPIYFTDPSVAFYSISWVSNTEKRENSLYQDYVSGYASTDPFEDFAESCAYYILHNKEFRILAKGNTQLEKKYLFLKNKVFEDYEFPSGENFVEANKRNWDTTLLSYDFRTFKYNLPDFRKVKLVMDSK